MSWHQRLDEEQRERLHAYETLLREINQHINLVSREDESHLFERHILHSLALTARPFAAGSILVDWGTGGGLPAIPLAIACPDVRVIAVDVVKKKIHAVRTMARRLDVENLDTWNGPADEFPGRTDYSVSRATAPLRRLWTWHARAARSPKEDPTSEFWKPGLLCLKGGDLSEEIRALKTSAPDVHVVQHHLADLSSDYNGAFFHEKYLVECVLPQGEPDSH